MLILDFRIWEKFNVGGKEPQFYYSDDPTQWGQQWCDAAWSAARNGVPVELYTGLKDSKGQKIYEGDVVDVWIGGCKQDTPYVVEDMRELYSEFHHDDGYYQFSEVEVIGNIHENPELLSKEEE